MSDEELGQEMLKQTKQLIQEHPELAVAAANEIGWTVVAPVDVSYSV